MVATLPFIKMHGLGNDFIVIDQHDAPLTPELAQKLCDRRFGIGADQILWLRKPLDSTAADIRMEILNADGSIAEMCGNGIRAVALHLHRRGRGASKTSYRVETLAGIKTVELQGTHQVSVDMGKPGLGKPQGEDLQAAGQTFHFHEVNMGNPHAVIFTDNVEKIPLETVGPQIETHSRFPKKTNVEFVQVVGPNRIRVRVWERGAGITLACGTGACGSAVAAIAAGKVKSPVEVQLPGGTLVISWAGGDAPVIMQGPAEEVYRGEIRI